MTLTPRQREVMAEVATGASYREVGNTLGITEHTVKIHVYDIRRRMEADSTIGVFVKLGWLKVPRFIVNMEDYDGEGKAG